MSNYDQLKAINIHHEQFKEQHNGAGFQTKDFEADLDDYIIFNNELYQAGKALEPLPMAIKLDYTGEINIYAELEESKIVRWIEYDLVFEKGKLTDVVAHEPILRKDNRDLSGLRPSQPSNRVEVTISVNNCDAETQNAIIDLLTDENIDEIRKVLQAPTANVFYPTKGTPDRFGLQASPRMIVSYVQKLEDFEAKEASIKTTTPNGDKCIIILDEMHYYSR